jgi:hypothetical protein
VQIEADVQTILQALQTQVGARLRA